MVTDARLRKFAVAHASYSPADRYILFELLITDAFSTLRASPRISGYEGCGRR